LIIAQEKNFENRIKKFLEDEGCWFVKFFANAYTKSGIPDILCCCNGYFLAIEVKAPKGEPSELQKMNIRKIIQCGGYGVILYPDQFDDFKDLVHLIGIHDKLPSLKIMDKINERWEK
jgi:hypothetical protein